MTAKKLKKNAVNSAKLKRGSVTSDKLRDGAVDSAKVEDGSLLRSDFEPGQLAGEAWYAPREPAVPLLVVTNDFAPVVTTETLPAGSYVLAARANVLGGGGVTSRLICSMLNDAAQLFEVVSGNVFPLSMSATAVLDEPATVSLNCLKNAGSPQIAQAHIIATSVAEDQRVDQPRLSGRPTKLRRALQETGPGGR